MTEKEHQTTDSVNAPTAIGVKTNPIRGRVMSEISWIEMKLRTCKSEKFEGALVAYKTVLGWIETDRTKKTEQPNDRTELPPGNGGGSQPKDSNVK